MNTKTLVCVIVVGIAARAVMVCLGATPARLTRLEPSIIAANINAGHGMTYEQYGAVYHAWKEPLYINLLAWLTRSTGESPVAVLLFQCCFGIGAAVGVAMLARAILGDDRRAVLAGMIAAVNPFLVYYDTRFIHPLSMDACLFIASIGATLMAVRQGARGYRRALAAGLVMGLTLWQRAAFLAAGVVSWIAAVVWVRPAQRWQMARTAALWLGIAALTISPWLVRNYHLFGRLVVTTDAAHILWLGNNPLSNGTFSDMEGKRVFYEADPAFQRRVIGASELEQHDIFFEEARRFIAEQPGRFGELVLGRLWSFLWFSPNAGISYTGRQNLVYRVAYVGLLGFGMAGLVLCWRRLTDDQRYRMTVLMASIAGLAMVHALTAINLKHRVPFELVLAIFASESCVRGLAMLGMRREQPAART